MKRKMKNVRNIGLISVCTIGMALASCSKAKDGVVIEDTYTGNVTGAKSSGDFTGSGDSGTYKYGWNNSSATASVSMDITTPTGSFQLILEDKKGAEVLNQTLMGASGPDSWSGASSAGEAGVWTVTFVFTDFNGDGSWSFN
ncbi:hypothetical protein JYT74_03915 [Crocinitomix catalasitica]|nr:hypothetical protein [Crocinitomix catalasitica]